MARGIAREHPDLSILDLAEGATVLPCYPYGVRPLFDKARFIEHQHAFRIAHRLGDELMVVPQHLLLIPERVIDKSLHPPDGAPSTWRAMGSMDWRSSLLNWPTIESKKWTRGSLRAKQS